MDFDKKILQFLKKHILNIEKVDIYTKALIHRSFSHKTDLNNERLEFLGDAVLEFIVTDYLYRNFNDFDEGKLSQIRSIIVSAKYLSNFAQELEIDKILVLGKGEEINGGRRKKSILSDAMESLIGAIYICDGLEKAKEFCMNFIEKNIESLIDSEELKNPKSKVQEISQKLYGSLPVYEVIKEEKKNGEIYYIMNLKIKDLSFGPVRMNSKRDAEQALAKMALEHFEKS
ncbi:MAG: ribonuclease III [Spirochaetota bacterium]